MNNQFGSTKLRTIQTNNKNHLHKPSCTILMLRKGGNKSNFGEIIITNSLKNTTDQEAWITLNRGMVCNLKILYRLQSFLF